MTGDPNAFQSWMIAIPTAVTAISTWYINRKTKKTSEASHTTTKQFVADNTSEIQVALNKLDIRVSEIESMLRTTKDCQILMAQKHAETMTMVSEEIRNAKVLIEARLPQRSAPAVAPGNTVSEDSQKDLGKVTVIEPPTQSHGKVVRKP